MDEFGDRIKKYEEIFTKQSVFCVDSQYVCIRLDGRSFSRFTKNMEKPFDEKMSNLMRYTTKSLVEHFKPIIGYTQSDEISLIFRASDMMFAGKIQKLVSVSAAYATAAFNKNLDDNLRGKFPHFDARLFSLPNQIEAANAILWRVHDAERNAISAMAQSLYSHKELQHKSTLEMLRMIREKNQEFYKLPSEFRYGSFFKRITEEVLVTEDDPAVQDGYLESGCRIVRSRIVNVLDRHDIRPNFPEIYQEMFEIQSEKNYA